MKMIDVTGGINGIRDKNLLSSAINNAFATFDSSEFFYIKYDTRPITGRN